MWRTGLCVRVLWLWDCCPWSLINFMAIGPLDYRQRAKPSADEAVFKHQQTKLFHCASLVLAASTVFVGFCKDPFYTRFFPSHHFFKSSFFSFFYKQIPCSEPNWAPTKERHNRYIFLGAHRSDSRTCLKFSLSETRPVKKVHSHSCLYAAAKLVSLFVFALFSVKYKLLQCWILIWNMNKVAVAIIRSSQAHSCSCERRSLCLQAAANQKKTGLKGEELKLFFQTEALHQGPTSANHEKLL